MARRPSSYAHATRMGNDERLTLGFARGLWGQITESGRAAMRDGFCGAGRRTCQGVPGSTMGMLVRECGTRTWEEG